MQQNYISQLPTKPQRTLKLNQDFRVKSLDSNHFELQFLKDVFLHIYSFSITPEPPMDSQKLIQLSLNQFRKEIWNHGLKKFCISGMNLWSYDQVQDDFHAEKEENKICLDIKYVKKINIKEITQKNDEQSISIAKQAINAILKQIYENRNMKEYFGKGKFYEATIIDNEQLNKFNISYQNGFRSVFCSSQSGPLIQIDYSTKLINTNSILEFMKEFNYSSSEKSKKLLIESLQDTSGLAMYSKRFYRIDDIDFEKNPNSKMESGDMSYYQYYQKRYKITIKDQSQPLLIHYNRKGQQLRLIPELMWKAGLSQVQKDNRKLKELLRPIVILDSQKRLELILKERNALESELKKQNIILKSDSSSQAYEIKKPKILCDGETKSFQGGCFEIKDQFYQQSELKEWILIYHYKEEKLAEKLVYYLQNNGNRYGLRFSNPYKLSMNNFNSKDWVSKLELDIQQNGIPELVVSLIDKKHDKVIYQKLKQYLIVKEGVSHQNVTLQLIENNKFGSIIPKLVQQIHSKLGNQTWKIEKIKEISDNIMIIGIDVYHKTVLKLDSCVGFNAQFGQQSDINFTKTLIVEKGKEINKEVAMLLEQSLFEYQRFNNNKLPDTIVVFRDGVGNSQINKLYQEEVETMKQIIKNKYNIKQPQFAFIMLNKRINDRFFSSSKENYGVIVADRVVSSHFDYFLIAQQVNQGTATPTHYTVLENSTDWNEELFWKFTYYQCYNYKNWCGPVKIPACVQNAHTAAYRIGEVIKQNASYYLETKLFYL